jgi:hypothetical protein
MSLLFLYIYFTFLRRQTLQAKDNLLRFVGDWSAVGECVSMIDLINKIMALRKTMNQENLNLSGYI